MTAEAISAPLRETTNPGSFITSAKPVMRETKIVVHFRNRLSVISPV